MSIFDECFGEELSLESRLFQAIDIDNLSRAFDLIAADADLSAFDWFGWTVLQCAQSKAMVELLIEHGADPDQLDEKGKTVWDTATPEMLGWVSEAVAERVAHSLAEATCEVAQPQRVARL